MAKARKDNKGRALLKGESQRTQDNRYVYTYTNPDGKRKYLYATTLQELREKEKSLIRDQLDGLDVYAAGKSDCLPVEDMCTSALPKPASIMRKVRGGKTMGKGTELS